MHKRKVDKDPSLQAMYSKLRKDFGPEITLADFVRFASANSSLTAPLMMLQLHIRRQIIGEAFWEKLTKQRQEHPEQNALDYVKKLQSSVVANKEAFQKRALAEEAERRRLSRLGRGIKGDCRANIVRTESRLMSFFNLKKHASVGPTRLVPGGVDSTNAHDLKPNYTPELEDEGVGHGADTADELIPANTKQKKSQPVKRRLLPSVAAPEVEPDEYVKETGHEYNSNLGSNRHTVAVPKSSKSNKGDDPPNADQG